MCHVAGGESAGSHDRVFHAVFRSATRWNVQICVC